LVSDKWVFNGEWTCVIGKTNLETPRN